MKKSVFVIISVCLICLLCACSSKTVDVSALEKEIISTVSFDTELREVPDNTVATLFNTLDGVTIKMYKGSSVCPDQFCIFTLSDTADRNKVAEQVGDYVKKLISDYKSYAPDEVPKLENALTALAKNCYLLVVTSDTENAKNIVDKYF